MDRTRLFAGKGRRINNCSRLLRKRARTKLDVESTMAHAIHVTLDFAEIGDKADSDYCAGPYVSAVVVLLFTGTLLMAEDPKVNSPLLADAEGYVQQRIAEFDQIPADRKSQLQKIADYVQRRIEAGQPARLTFICTHNSRRSQMAQIWAAVAARNYVIPGVETFSGGTEATAFNPRAIAAVERAGLLIEADNLSQNPHYSVSFQVDGESLDCFSKVYHQAPNPQQDYCAVMTCSQADQACPVVEGAALRVALPFDDPKVSDGTPEESRTYDERCAQICRDMLYLFSRIKT